MEQSKKFRKVIFYKSYFDDFLVAQSIKVQKKIIWTIELIEDLEMVPEIYLKHLENTKGLYEIRVQQGKNNYRIFCFFEKEKLIKLVQAAYNTIFRFLGFYSGMLEKEKELNKLKKGYKSI